MVVSVADPPKTDNVWARRKAEQDQRDADRKGMFSSNNMVKGKRVLLEVNDR